MSLYNLPVASPSQNQMDEYLASSSLPTLSSTIQEELEVPITLEELQCAVKAATLGKSLGLDGLIIQYYKLFTLPRPLYD